MCMVRCVLETTTLRFILLFNWFISRSTVVWFIAWSLGDDVIILGWYVCGGSSKSDDDEELLSGGRVSEGGTGGGASPSE